MKRPNTTAARACTKKSRDVCRVRTGHAPENLAVLRNLCLGLLRRTRHCYVPVAIRRFLAHPLAALALIRPGAPPPEEDF